jgi:hypothetical protein
VTKTRIFDEAELIESIVKGKFSEFFVSDYFL